MEIESYQWLLNSQYLESIHPSLQRQATINMAYGLYEVVLNRIDQVRGYEVANISFIKGDRGWIAFNSLTAKETTRAALDFINNQLSERPVTAVVISYSHANHFGGICGVVDEANERSSKVPVITRQGLLRWDS